MQRSYLVASLGSDKRELIFIIPPLPFACLLYSPRFSTQMKQKKNSFHLLVLLRQSFIEIRKSDVLRMAGATAFFATFALPAILIIIIQLFGLFVNPRFLNSRLIDRLNSMVGKESGEQIQLTLVNFSGLAANWYVTIIGFLFLVFVATTLFNVIRNSLDDIWQIKVESHPGFLFNIFVRTKSFIVILIAGILFLFALFTDGLDVYLDKSMKELPSTAGFIFQLGITQIISTIIFTAWFVILFRFLADGRPSWLASIAGGIVSGILFTAGKLFIKWVLTNSNIGTLYGASGSIVLLLLFVFYSSFALYFGAAFIKSFSDGMKDPIEPINKAFRYQLKETS